MALSLLVVLCVVGVVLILWLKRSSTKSITSDENDLLEFDSVRRAVRSKLALKSASQKRQERVQRPQQLHGVRKSKDDGKCWRGEQERTRALPPGQYPAKKWIVLDLGLRPSLADYDPWRDPLGFTLQFCSASRVTSVSLGELYALGARRYRLDWHCVTGWSFTDSLELVGVPLSRVIKYVSAPLALDDDWQCLFQVSADGYTAPILRIDLDECLKTHGVEPFLAVARVDAGSNAAMLHAEGESVGEDGQCMAALDELELLSLEHGGPRIVVPSLYGWKSAKFLREVHFLREYRAGFWEALGCHARGRHALNERWSQESARVWNVLAWITQQYQRWFGYRVWVWVMQLGGALLGFVANKFLGAFQRSSRSTNVD